MIKQPIKSSKGPRSVGAFSCKTEAERAALAQNFQRLASLGINLTPGLVNQMHQAAVSMDADLVGLTATTASMPTPVQYLQTWLPGFVEVVTAARKIDELIGIQTQGEWHHEEVVQGILEFTGTPRPYQDYTGTPLSSWNANWEHRSIVRFEEGLQVGKLEEAQTSAADISSADSKRKAAAMALEIERNRIGFFGYNGGANRTYGLLNDPNLPAYDTVPDGASTSPEWSTKTFQEIVKDLLTAYSDLRAQSQDLIDPTTTPITLAIASNAVDYLSVVTDFGKSVRSWITETYPNTRIVSIPEFNDANGGVGVFYAYAETVGDSGTDDGRTFSQVVPSKFTALGVKQELKYYEEAFTNATAGIYLKRPYACKRYSGIS